MKTIQDVTEIRSYDDARGICVGARALKRCIAISLRDTISAVEYTFSDEFGHERTVIGQVGDFQIGDEVKVVFTETRTEVIQK